VTPTLRDFTVYPTSVTLTWDLNGNNSETQYQYSLDGGAALNVPTLGANFYTVSGLAPNSQHTFQVIAAGFGSTVSDLSQSTWTKANTPLEPLYVNTIAVDKLQFGLNTSNNPPYTEYALFVRQKDSPDSGVYLGHPSFDKVALATSTTPVWLTASDWGTLVDASTYVFTADQLPTDSMER
jgi:hypothetical protein